MSSIGNLMIKGIRKKLEKLIRAQMGSSVEIGDSHSLAYQSPLSVEFSFFDENGVKQEREIVAIYDRNDPNKVKLYSDYALPDALAKGNIEGKDPHSDIYADMMKLKEELVLLKNGIRK